MPRSAACCADPAGIQRLGDRSGGRQPGGLDLPDDRQHVRSELVGLGPVRGVRAADHVSHMRIASLVISCPERLATQDPSRSIERLTAPSASLVRCEIKTRSFSARAA